MTSDQTPAPSFERELELVAQRIIDLSRSPDSTPLGWSELDVPHTSSHWTRTSLKLLELPHGAVKIAKWSDGGAGSFWSFELVAPDGRSLAERSTFEESDLIARVFEAVEERLRETDAVDVAAIVHDIELL